MARRKIEGTPGDDNGPDALMGDDEENIVRGYAGDDYLDGGGGRDRLHGDAGDDMLIFDGIDRIIDGGDGIDTLRFLAGGQTCTLSRKRVIDDIEVIDFASSDNNLIFSFATLRKMLSNDTLVITGDTDNWVDPGGGWQFDGFSDDGRFYLFTQRGITLKTEPGLQVDGLNIWTPMSLSDASDYWVHLPEGDNGIALHVYGKAGHDTVTSNGAMDQLFGDDGDDFLESYGIGAILHGGDGDDALSASATAVMYGDAGTDLLHLIGDGIRIAEGGEGADLFLIYLDPELHSDFRILDFSPTEGDRLRIRVANNESLGPSDLYLQSVDGSDTLYALGYVDASSNAHTIVQITGSNLELSALLPDISIL